MNSQSLPVGLAIATLAAAVLAASCSLPRVYRLSVQQGNVITQEMVDGLKPGMTREQVAYIMGEPVIRNPFDDSRWDYVYTLRVPGYLDDQAMMSLFFTDGVLSHFIGDFKPSDESDRAGPEGSAREQAEGSAREQAEGSAREQAEESAGEQAGGGAVAGAGDGVRDGAGGSGD